MFCGQCGSPMEDGDKFCMKCGWSAETTTEDKKTASMAAVPAPAQPEQVAAAAASAPAAQGAYAAPASATAPASTDVSLGMIYHKVFAALASKPVMLWGLSVLCSIMGMIALALSGAVPLIYVAAEAILVAGMAVVYLDGYRRLPVNSEQLFEGFKNIGRVAGGMGWMYLWIFLWFLVPFAGPFLAIWKAISYSFTPYILMRNPNVTTLQALKLSMQQTKGRCGTIFLTYLVAVAAIFVAFILIWGITGAMINSDISGLIFFAWLIKIVFLVAYFLAGPLFFGLVSAAFYSEIVIDGGASQELAPAVTSSAAQPLP